MRSSRTYVKSPGAPDERVLRAASRAEQRHLSHAGVVTSQRTVALAYGTLINGRWRASAMRRWALGRPISRVGPAAEPKTCAVWSRPI